MKVLIIEDEKFSAQRLERQLRKLDATIEVLSVLESVQETLDWFSTHINPDLIFMDIHLQDKNSFEIFDELEITTPIIYTTAYDNYALQAFKQNSVDYLLKPIDVDELAKALGKFKSIYDIQSEAIEVRNRFLVKKGSQYVSVLTEEIAYFKSESKLNYLVTTKGDKYVLDISLDVLAKELEPSNFFRINRSRIVCFGSIVGIHSYFNNRLKLDLAPIEVDEVLVSRDRVTAFKEWLDH